ncbi:MAG TPA: class I SAM-dependent methyltransferase [Candidatus Bathyarchaeia archaeon]|nr:class I SAM-dependent methyltransferase [Candidatus Bathyarchaeia archaeon]
MNPYELIVKGRTAQIGTANGKPGSTAQCLQIDDEICWLAPFIADLKPERILEIGFYKGGWQYVLAPWFSAGGNIIGIDSMQRHQQDNGRAEMLAMIQRLEVAGFTVWMFETRSDNPATLIAMRAMKGKIDLLHIDGAHDYASALADWQNYGPLVRRGGLAVLHDIGTQTAQMNVKRLWEEIRGEYPGRTHEIYVKNGIGVVEM